VPKIEHPVSLQPRQWSKIAILANLPSRGPLLDYHGNSASNLTG